MRFWLAALVAVALAACVSVNALPRQAGTWLEAAVRLQGEAGHGSGIVVGPNLILTARHVSAHDETMNAVFYDGTTRKITVIWEDEAQDIALLSFDGPAHGTALPVSCAPVSWGQTFWWIGQPNVAEWIMRSGYVALVEPEKMVEVPSPTVLVVGEFVGGDSGSGLISEDGSVIGVATVSMTDILGGSPFAPDRTRTMIGGMSPTATVCGALRAQTAAIRFDA